MKYVSIFFLFILQTSLVFLTLLDDYLSNEFDESWYVLHEDGNIAEGLSALLYVKSQKWHGIDWYHRVGVFVPKNLKYKDAGVVFIAGDFKHEEFLSLKKTSSWFEAPFIAVWDIPNQPIFGLREDGLISYTFYMFFKTHGKDWPLLLPMVQGVRASLNAAISYLNGKDLKVKKFMATGASKRGWTSYLVGATDKRIFAIAPIVFDNLNFTKQMDHQLDVYGWYSEKIKTYWSKNLMEKMKSDLGRELLDAVDPYSYIDRLYVPKLIILATNDRYWVVDSLNIYFDDLKGLKYVLYNPNERHRISHKMRLIKSMSAFFKGVLLGKLPKIEWEYNDDTQMMIKPNGKVRKLVYYVAHSNSLDFRDAIWRIYEDYKKCGDNYIINVEKPDKGYIAYFAEVGYEDYPSFLFTTTIKIIGSK